MYVNQVKKIFFQSIKIISFIMLMSTFSWSDITTCPGNELTSINGTSISITDSINSISIPSRTSHFYYFTPDVDGTIQVDSESTTSRNSLLIYSGTCTNTNTLWSDVSNSDNKSSDTINVDAGTKIIIEFANRRNKTRSYTLNFTFISTPSTPPVMGDIPNQTTNIDETFSTLDISNYVTLTNNDPITSYTLTGTLPTGMSFNTTTGVLSGTPTETGSFSLSVAASDKDGISNYDSFVLTVNTATPPEMGDVPDQDSDVDVAFTSLYISNYVTLTNNDPITSYTLTGTLPTGMSFDTTTGVLSGTPTETGSFSLSVIATDEDGDSNADTFTLTIAEALTETTGGRDFIQRTQHSIFGDVKVLGNTVLCILSNGACVEPSTTNSNAGTNLEKAPESYSTLTLPTNSNIVYARIYWQGRLNENDSWTSTAKTASGKIKIRQGNSGAYTELTADIQDFDTTSNIPIYSASADASGIVDSNGTYYIDTSSFYTITGDTPDGLGAYGAWTLVVVYEDSDETKARNITVFDGYKQVTKNTGNIDINVTGFLTPKTGDVDSQTYVFTAEGDKYISGDVIKMAGATYNTTLQTLGTFDSRIDVTATRNPNLTNNNGIDIHKYDTGTTSGAENIITNNETGAKFQFTSTQDTYFPSLIVFSTELYLPQLCYDYSLKQDGQYFYIDRATYPTGHIDTTISTSDIEVGIYLKNQEADIIAEGIAIKSDVNDTVFDMDNNISTSNVNGSVLVDRGNPTLADTLCDYDQDGDNLTTNNGCTNGHDIRKGNGSLDAGEYVYTQYTLTPANMSSGLEDINETLGLSIKYYITVNGEKIEYPDYELGGSNVPLCDTSSQYSPTWGEFNVVESGKTTNNIETQVASKPFDASVIFDSDTDTGTNDAPSTDVNTTVLVEVIDVDSYGDLNASCSNPDSSLSTAIFVPINFNSSDYQTQITIQDSSYYNFAVKNAAFRIWYFKHSDESLIQGWTATTSSDKTTVTKISGLYDADKHSLCQTTCSADSNSTDCFDCIKGNYAEAICSRDNFSVRPESFDIRVYDINQTATTAQKDTTKIDLSDLLDYEPTATTPTDRVRLATGYDYRFDINSTNHESLTATSGYTRNFSTSNASDYNATLIWDPTTTVTNCNDTNDKVQSFYIANGTMEDTETSISNVGEYRLNIVDSTWTAVDFDSSLLTHHKTADGFTTGEDCDTSSTTTNPTSGNKVGCTISSSHTNTATSPNHIYKDIDMTFKPYTFNIPTFTGNTFRYFANVDDNDSNIMSVNYSGNIEARGYDNTVPSNYVGGCFADNLNVTMIGNIELNTTSYKIRFIDYNSTNVVQADFTRDINNSVDNNFSDLNLSSTFFRKDNNGAMDINISMNYERNSTIPNNPLIVQFRRVDVNCSVASDCQINADLKNDYNITGRDDFTDINVTHYYGRVHAPDQRFDSAIGTAQVYYEVYCDDCNKTKFNIDGNESIDSINWFTNTLHGNSDGNVSSYTSLDAVAITNPSNINNGIATIDLQAPNTPYKDKINMNSSSWLIYNPTDFMVEFYGTADWAGQGIKGKTVDLNISRRQNKRLDW